MKFILNILLILSLVTLLNITIVSGLQCYLCFGCRNTTASAQTCSATQTFCYSKTYTTNLYVEKGCIDKCIPGIQATDGANVTCCNTTLCNYDNTVALQANTTTTTQSGSPTTTTTTAAQSSSPTTKTTTTTTTAAQSSSPTTKTTTTTTTAAQSSSPTTKTTTTTTTAAQSSSPTTKTTTTTTTAAQSSSPTTKTTTTTTTAAQSSSPTTKTTTTTTTTVQSSSPTTKTTTTTTTTVQSTSKPQTISPQLTNGKPNLQCYFCIGCNSTNMPISVTCSANDTFCFTQTYNSFTQMGCSNKCTSGFHPTDNSYISCCNTNLCNTYQTVPPSQTTVSSIPISQSTNRPIIQSSSTTYYLECYSCNDCQNSNNIIESCYSDQRYCYKEVSNNFVKKGCASSCMDGLTPSNSRIYCCNGNRCNSANRNFKINFILVFVSAFVGFVKNSF